MVTKMDKKLILFVVSIAFTLILVSSVLASVLDISLEQDPYPVKAGENLELTFSIENTGTENLTNVVFDLDVNDPLTLKSNSERTIDINAGETKTIKYDLFVESDANDGEETITLNYEIDGNDYDKDFDVLIAPGQVYLQIDSVSSNPGNAAPGSNITININLRNTANSEVKDIVLALDLTNMPFAPESVTEERIGNIGDRGQAQVAFNLIALPSAEIGIYKIPLQISYSDSYGNEYTRQDLISVEIFESPDVDLILNKNNLVIGMPSNISIDILNKGLGKVNFVEVSILPSSDYDILENNYLYLGSIESDDYSSAEFKITPKKENITILYNIEYRDLNNQKYDVSKTLSIEAYSVSEAQRLGLLPAFPWFVVIVILVVIALIIFFIVRRNKKKKKLMREQE